VEKAGFMEHDLFAQEKFLEALFSVLLIHVPVKR
jgi:hypothetical protein